MLVDVIILVVDDIVGVPSIIINETTAEATFDKLVEDLIQEHGFDDIDDITTAVDYGQRLEDVNHYLKSENMEIIWNSRVEVNEYDNEEEEEEEENLEEIFNNSFNKRQIEVNKYRQVKIDRWNQTLQRMNEIYDKISFLETKGIKIEKVHCTEFNEKEADRGFYPYLRLPQFLACAHPIFNDDVYTFGFSSCRISGKYNVKTFIEKIVNEFK